MPQPDPLPPTTQSARVLGYLRTSHGLFNSLILVVPVFAIYQLGIIIQLAREGTHSFSFNGADLFTSRILSVFGGSLVAYIIFVLLITGIFVALLRRMHKGEDLKIKVVPYVLVESSIYALLLGSTIHLMLSLNQPTTLWMKVFHAFGAGFNEELIFRLSILGGMVLIGRKLSLPELFVVVFAVIASSALFSLFHYYGPYAHPFTFDSFMFRFLAGVYLATLYWWRGLAVAVYTHILYDLYYFLVVS